MVESKISKARARARKHIERLYESVCTTYLYKGVYDEKTHRTVQKLVENIIEAPCHLAYSASPATSETVSIASLTQSIVLYLAPELEIPAGSLIEVTTNGVTVAYKASGQANLYETHQEISLKLADEEA